MQKRNRILLSTICPYTYKDIQLALYYLKAYFIKNSSCNSLFVAMDIEVFGINEKLNKIVRDITKMRPDIVGFSCYIWNITNILKVAKAIKRTNTNLILVLGGPEVTARAEEILEKEKYVDIVVRGEGEETFKELVECLAYRKIDLVAIKGISYRIKNRVFCNSERPPISDMDSIPSPYLEGLIDLRKYPDYIELPTETMRGCFYRCHYCYYHKEFKEVRYFSLKRIEKELKYILAKEPPRVYLMDPTFNVYPERAKKILRLFAKYNKKSKLHLELKIEFIDKEMAGILRKANADHVEIGVQTANPKSLKLINRTFNRGVFIRNTRLLNKYGIRYELQLIDSLPQDTYNDLKRSLDWALSLYPPLIKIMRLMVLPGTYLRHHARRFGITYNTKPPYFSYKSDTMSRADLRRVGLLRSALTDLTGTSWLKETIYLLKRRLSINFSDILEEWGRFKRRRPSRFMLPMNKTFALFIKYLCDKYGKSSRYDEIHSRLVVNSMLADIITERKNMLPNWKLKNKPRICMSNTGI